MGKERVNVQRRRRTMCVVRATTVYAVVMDLAHAVLLKIVHAVLPMCNMKITPKGASVMIAQNQRYSLRVHARRVLISQHQGYSLRVHAKRVLTADRDELKRNEIKKSYLQSNVYCVMVATGIYDAFSHIRAKSSAPNGTRHVCVLSHGAIYIAIAYTNTRSPREMASSDRAIGIPRILPTRTCSIADATRR